MKKVMHTESVSDDSFEIGRDCRFCRDFNAIKTYSSGLHIPTIVPVIVSLMQTRR